VEFIHPTATVFVLLPDIDIGTPDVMAAAPVPNHLRGLDGERAALVDDETETTDRHSSAPPAELPQR
jgi:hypothetical protein